MPETTYLHIRSREAVPTRVVELRDPSVRIGRGAQCEVRLAEPVLAEVQCLLRRRGETWHVQPVGPTGRVSIDGRPVDQQRPLPPGAALRVGDSWLSLRPAGFAPADGLGTFPAPILLEASAAAPASGQEPSAAAAREGFGPAGDGLEAERQRLERWQARLQQRERWLKERQEERRWEARWRAAAENLQGRPAPGTSRSSPAPPPPRPAESVIPAEAPARLVPLAPRMKDIPPACPPLRSYPVAATKPSTIREVPSIAAPQRGPLQDRRGGDFDTPVEGPGPGVSKPPPRPPDEDPVSPLRPCDPARGEGQDEDAIPLERNGGEALQDGRSVEDFVPGPGPSTGAESSPARPPEADPTEACAPVIRRRGRRWARWFGRGKGGRGPQTAPEPVPEDGIALPATVSDACKGDAAGTVDDNFVVETDDGPIESRAEVTASERIPERSPEPLEPIVEEPSATGPTAIPPPSEAEGASWRAPDPEWPSALAILEAARRACPPGTAAPRAAARRAANRTAPTPTAGQLPGHWKVPLLAWLWTPAVALLMTVGAGGLRLCWLWALDDRAAGTLADRWLRAETGRDGDDAAEGVDPGGPEPSWWSSTAGHMLLHARAAQGRGADSGAERVEFLLHAARHSAPAHAGVRFALARLGQDRGGPDPGLSRDVVALAWQGHLRLEAGRPDEALASYRAALEMAGRAALTRLDPPAFQEDLQVRRYALPYEDLIGPVVRDLADHGDWTFETWSQALPAFAVAPLVAARVLRERGSADADRALEQAVAAAEAPPPPGCSPAVHRAAGAEALALLGRWGEAEDRYRQAVAQMPDDRIRRSWWVNLADLYARLGDAEKTQSAREAAKGTDPGEEITRRVIEAQVHDGVATPRT